MSNVSVIPPSPTSDCSDRRAAANRANARKSTGPRTSEGKVRSAMNAVKTGCFARTPLLPGEEPGELEAYIAEIIEDLNPATAVERDLAERVAGLSWRRRRLWRAEEEIIAKEFGPPMDEEEAEDVEDELEEFYTDQHREDAELQAEIDAQVFLAQQFTGREPGPLVRLADHERRLSGSIEASLRMLLKLQDRRTKRGEIDVPDQMPAAPIEPIEGRPPLLAPARRPALSLPNGAELPPDTRVAPAAPNEAIAPMVTAAPTNEPTAGSVSCVAPRIAPAQNEPIASSTACAPDINWTSIAAAAASAVSTDRVGRCGRAGSASLSTFLTEHKESGAALRLPRRG
jgi:hypothetical protein